MLPGVVSASSGPTSITCHSPRNNTQAPCVCRTQTLSDDSSYPSKAATALPGIISASSCATSLSSHSPNTQAPCSGKDSATHVSSQSQVSRCCHRQGSRQLSMPSGSPAAHMSHILLKPPTTFLLQFPAAPDIIPAIFGSGSTAMKGSEHTP